MNAESKKDWKKESKKDWKKERKKSQTSKVCRFAKKCGGCQYIELPYEKQLKKKQHKVKELLGEFGKVEPIIGMENPFNYRNKVNATFARDRKGNILAGVYEEGTHHVVPIEDCRIEDERGGKIIQTIKGMLRSFKILVYDEDTGYGLLRHVLVRTAHVTGQVMVVLVTATPVFPSKNNFVKALRARHPEITTIVQNINDRKTSMVLGTKEHVLYGKGYIEDELLGCRFRISPRSFYQVNPIQTQKLYQTAIDYAHLTGKEKFLDAYCGTGTIGIIASFHAGEVIGVELNHDAVRDAIINAKQNARKNISFYEKDAGEFMIQMAEQNAHVDVVMMDPPRSGSDEAFLSSVCRLRPDRCVYISCNPVTLQRDLRYLTANGYRVKRMQPVDMFPATAHIEVVCALTRA